MKPLDLLGQLSRGEPITLAAVLIAVFGELGMQLAPGDADTLVASGGRVATILVGLYLARRHTTPYANPVVRAHGKGDVTVSEAGDPTGPGTAAVDTKPVITLAGKRPA